MENIQAHLAIIILKYGWESTLRMNVDLFTSKYVLSACISPSILHIHIFFYIIF